MSRDILWLSVDDDRFIEFYEPLAHALEGHGRVFTPYPVIAPNRRAAVPRPHEVLVVLADARALDILRQAAERFLATYGDCRIGIESAACAFEVARGDLTDLETLRARLRLP